MNPTPTRLEINDIECPKCRHKFALSEAVQLSLADQVQNQVQGSLAQERQRLEEENNKTVQLEVAKALEIQKKASERQIDLNKKEAEAKEVALADSIRAQRDLMKAKLDLENQIRNSELEKMQAVEAARRQTQEITRVAEEERSRLVVADLQRQLRDVTDQLGVAQRRAQQGSQEAQGEVLEEMFQAELQKVFRAPDNIREIKKGERGADMVLEINDLQGNRLGAVLFETKRAENWSQKWVSKIKQDLVENRADVGVIVATNLPDGVRHFGMVDGIWVASPSCGLQLAQVLRRSLCAVAEANTMKINTADRAQVLYRYVRSSEFRQMVELVVNSFINLKSDLDKEKNSMQRHWKAREQKIEMIRENFIKLVGGTDGLAELGDIKGLSLGDSEQSQLPQGETVGAA
jgi:hypothetical protein